MFYEHCSPLPGAPPTGPPYGAPPQRQARAAGGTELSGRQARSGWPARQALGSASAGFGFGFSYGFLAWISAGFRLDFDLAGFDLDLDLILILT